MGGVLTGKQLRESSLGKQPKEADPVREPLDIQETAKEPEKAPEDSFRMHHPDDPSKSMTCKILFMDQEIEIQNGVAVVDESVAAELEKRGWLRGSKVEKDNWK